VRNNINSNRLVTDKTTESISQNISEQSHLEKVMYW